MKWNFDHSLGKSKVFHFAELLARTEAKREERTKERLKAYMKKNYKVVYTP